jgi:hypothetical protein
MNDVVKVDKRPTLTVGILSSNAARISGDEGTSGSPAYACATADQSVCARRFSGRTNGSVGHDFAGTLTAPWRSISERIVETLR